MEIPAIAEFGPEPEVTAAIQWVNDEFPDNPGSAGSFNGPVTHAQAAEALEDFIAERLELFGPYEDAIAAGESYLFHSALSSSLNIGLLNPRGVLEVVLDAAARNDVSIASMEGYVRQLIGWREYLRAAYCGAG